MRFAPFQPLLPIGVLAIVCVQKAAKKHTCICFKKVNPLPAMPPSISSMCLLFVLPHVLTYSSSNLKPYIRSSVFYYTKFKCLTSTARQRVSSGPVTIVTCSTPSWSFLKVKPFPTTMSPRRARVSITLSRRQSAKKPTRPAGLFLAIRAHECTGYIHEMTWPGTKDLLFTEGQLHPRLQK